MVIMFVMRVRVRTSIMVVQEECQLWQCTVTCGLLFDCVALGTSNLHNRRDDVS